MKIRHIIFVITVLILGGLGFIFIPKIMAVTVTMDTTADITFTGSVVASADVNGDGYMDAIVGHPLAASGGYQRGEVYVYLGGAGGMNNVADITLTGAVDGDRFGTVVSAGYVNGDGKDDVIVATRYADTGGGTWRGRAYIYYGGDPMDTAVDVTFTGTENTGNFGVSAASAGDVNNDTFDDVIIGADNNAGGGTSRGQAYIYYGAAGTSMDNVEDVIINGAANNDHLGFAVASAGDVNNDTFDDVIVGAYLADGAGTDRGQAYIYYGGASMDNTADVTFTGTGNSDHLGYSVASAGDVNGDTFDDVIVGALWADYSGDTCGKAYIYYGGASMNDVADVTFNGTVAYGFFGYAVASVGDVNGDTYDDVIVGSVYDDNGGGDSGSERGKAYVYYGGASMDNVADVTFRGVANGDYLGTSVASAGDVNGDTYNDVIVGASGAGSGLAYIYTTTVTGVPAAASDETPVVSISRNPAAEVTLSYPNGGETFAEGEEVEISWIKNWGVKDVDLSLVDCETGDVKPIAQKIPEVEVYPWIIPDGFATPAARIRVKSFDRNGFSGPTDESDECFAINKKDGTPAVSGGSSILTISNVSAKSGLTSAAITWDTNLNSDTEVAYGLTTDYSATSTFSNFVTTHGLTLQGLTQKTTYYFRVISTDGNRIAYSAGSSFTTGFVSEETVEVDLSAPVISELKAFDITTKSAAISFDTNEAAEISFGFSWKGGKAPPKINESATEHIYALSGLLPNTEYFVDITATDASGNASAPSRISFKTLKDDVPPADVAKFAATPGDANVTLTWVNPKDADFAEVILYREGISPKGKKIVIYRGRGAKFTNIGLINGNSYSYTIVSRDTSNNYSAGVTAEATPVAPPPVVPPEETIVCENGAFRCDGTTRQVCEVNQWVLNEENSALCGYVAPPAPSETVPPSPGPSVGPREPIPEVLPPENATSTPPALEPPNVLGTVISSETETPVAEAAVTLYESTEEGWKVFDAVPSEQSNPAITPADGAYGFTVPEGTYYLEVKHGDFVKFESQRFEVKGAVVRIEPVMLLIPPTFEEALRPNAPLPENARNILVNLLKKIIFVGKIDARAIGNFISNPVVEDANRNIAAPTLIGVAVANTVTAIPIFSLWSFIQFLFTEPFLLLQRRKRKGWGVVYNALTKLPVDLAIVRLLNAKTRRIIQTRVTDKLGRFVFFAAVGEYLVEVTKRGFVSPSVFLKTLKEDETFTDLYHGEILKVTDKDGAITPNIPLDPVEQHPSKAKLILKNILRSFQYGLSLSGLALVLISFIITPTLLIAGFVVAHVLLYLLFRRLAKTPAPKSWGIVYDEKSKKPLHYTIARIFETQYNKLLSTQITDTKGRYSFLVGENVYYVTFEHPGYEPAKTPAIDLVKKRADEMVALNMPMKLAGVPEEIRFGETKI
jgi:hypothetical protein